MCKLLPIIRYAVFSLSFSSSGKAQFLTGKEKNALPGGTWPHSHWENSLIIMFKTYLGRIVNYLGSDLSSEVKTYNKHEIHFS